LSIKKTGLDPSLKNPDKLDLAGFLLNLFYCLVKICPSIFNLENEESTTSKEAVTVPAMVV
jgi:hypothetical protein